MLTFQDFLNEGAGSLAGMPQPFIKALTNWKLGGENSKIELYKTSAKQKDLTSALKHIGGYVKPEDKGRKTYSPAEKEAAARTKEYAGVAIKVDGEWAFIGEFDEYDNKYRLLSPEGYKSKEDYKSSTARHKGYKYTRSTLTATELSDFINFTDSKVDVYLVTVDKNRIEKQAERGEAKAGQDSMKDVKDTAIIKFLNNKSGGLIDSLSKTIEDQTSELVKTLQDTLTFKAGESINIKAAKDELAKFERDIGKILDDYNALIYHSNDIVKSGKISDKWRDSKKTYSYERFKDIVDRISGGKHV